MRAPQIARYIGHLSSENPLGFQWYTFEVSLNKNQREIINIRVSSDPTQSTISYFADGIDRDLHTCQSAEEWQNKLVNACKDCLHTNPKFLALQFRYNNRESRFVAEHTSFESLLNQSIFSANHELNLENRKSHTLDRKVSFTHDILIYELR